MKTAFLPLLFRRLLVPAVVLAFVPASHADLTLTQQLDQPGRPQPVVMTIKVQGAMVRSEISPEMTVIMDSRTGETTTLMHAQKMAMTLPGGVVKAAQAAAMGSVASAAATVPTPTGRSETINGFLCKEYSASHEGKDLSVWITEEIPDAEGIMAQLALLSPEANPLAGALEGTKITGFPIRTSVNMGPLGKVTMTIVSLTRDDLPAADFTVPKNYKKMEMPKIPGLPGM